MASPSTAKNYEEMWAQLRQRLAPAALSNLQTNADLIAHHIHRNKLNGLSVDDELSAVTALQDKLLWDVEPVAPAGPTAAQKAIEDAKKQQARMRRDYFDSIKGKDVQEVQKNNAADAQDAKKVADEKELKSIKSQIRSRIEGYRANHPSVGIDWGRTESNQATLRSVLAKAVGGHASESLDQLLIRVTLQNGKDALSAVNSAFFKMS